MGKQVLLNTFINNETKAEAVDSIEALLHQEEPAYVVFINSDVVLKMEKDPALKGITDEADRVYVDGKPLVWFAKWLAHPVKEKVSGSDLAPLLYQRASERGLSIFFLGGMPEVQEAARARLSRMYPDLKLAGFYSPPLGFEQDEEEMRNITTAIQAAQPDLLFACLGCPKQEKWVREHFQHCGAKVCICCGAVIDFTAGTTKRAPVWMSEHGLEWFYRFCQNPTRLFKRYFIDDLQIFRLVWKYRFQRKSGLQSGEDVEVYS